MENPKRFIDLSVRFMELANEMIYSFEKELNNTMLSGDINSVKSLLKQKGFYSQKIFFTLLEDSTLELYTKVISSKGYKNININGIGICDNIEEFSLNHEVVYSMLDIDVFDFITEIKPDGDVYEANFDVSKILKTYKAQENNFSPKSIID